MTTPPPLPPRHSRKYFYRNLATASIFAIPVAIAVNTLSSASASSLDPQAKTIIGMISGCLGLLILVSGVVAGIIALFGIRKYGKKGILIKALCGILIPVVLTVLAIPALLNARAKALQIQANAKSVEAQLSLVAERVNKQEPVMIDEDTKLDGAEALPGRILVYKYTLSLARAELPANLIEQNIRPNLLEAYKAHPDMKTFREEGVTIVYRYKDRSGEAIGEVSVGPKDL